MAMASALEPATWGVIANIADGINHAVPTHTELQTSVSWLIKNDLVVKTGKKYSLSEKGKSIMEAAESKSSIISKLLKILAEELSVSALRIEAETGRF